MNSSKRLTLAIQKSGRLSKKSLDLLARCGLVVEARGDQLTCRCLDFPLDLLFVRDDDIPEYVHDNICDLGIVGYNVLEEKLLSKGRDTTEVIRELGFGTCRLSIAVPARGDAVKLVDLCGKRIATSYPSTLSAYLRRSNINADVIEISGSVEIAPTVGIADGICDLVSTGSTLVSNGLVELTTVLESQAVLIRSKRRLDSEKEVELQRLGVRIDGVLKASRAKYIMMNAPKAALETICSIIPGMEQPTVVPLSGQPDRVAVHAVATEDVFWETMERLKKAGATSILVTPIEKIID